MNIPNIHASMRMHNHFKAVVKDAHTGEVKQEATAYNVVLDNFYSSFLASAYNNFDYIQIGIGTGEPRVTDTTLFNRKYTLQGSASRKAISENTLQVTTVATSPVGNTGAFTEVGFGSTYYLMTHAMFTDAENNPIVITQTSTDILEITAVAFITLNVSNELMTFATHPATIMNSQFGSSGVNNSIIPSRLGVGLATSLTINKDVVSDKFFLAHGAFFGLSGNSGELVNSTLITSNTPVRMDVNRGNFGFYNYMLLGFAGVNSAGNGNLTYPSCYVKFPNNAVFPLYTIERMPVGVGDGTTSSFNCPIEMFVKDSDVVRVDGVVLTRNIDYTIDHHSNHNENIGCTPGAIAKLSSDATRRLDYQSYKLFSPQLINDTSLPQVVLTHNSPLYIELDDTDETIGTTVNYVKLGRLRTTASSVANSMSNAVYTLEYSIDGNIYTEVASLTVGSNFSDTIRADFQPIKAKYWRLSVDMSNVPGFGGYITADTPIYQANPGGATVLGYKGTGISFINPPAAGAVIDIDVTIDRPYKSTDYVIDLAANMNISH